MNRLRQKQSQHKKRIAFTVTNDLVTDNRVHKIATTLLGLGFDVTLIGRIQSNSQTLTNRPYSTFRMGLWFNKGPLFYANYNLSLLSYLLFKKFDCIVSNDLDTLLACFIASKITKKELVYDSHEYFTEVPELVDRPLIKKSWEVIEKKIVPKLKHCYTVCQSIANVYNTKYGTNFKVVRNIPLRLSDKKNHKEFTPPFPTDLPIILYQGAVNYGRGIEEAIVAMHQINNARLVIIGTGDEFEQCKYLVQKEQLQDKVLLTGRIPFEQLKYITPYATVGLSIEKDIGLNYRYALPNKLFDYIQSKVPILASELPEIKKVVNEYNVGTTIKHTSSDLISEAINKILSSPNQLKKWKQNCAIAAEELCWENEEKIIKEIYINLFI
ncbi:MAG: glycosyltransferase [Prolixibacteraceae bacterium]|jgi:glycosyltransferase involved in cell wall biosynthesis|nr:glycosyltransferase [Prolixibacteraceae bacterium]